MTVRMAGNLVQGAVFTVMVVRASMLRDPEFQDELSRQIDRSPRFFQNAPVVLDLKGAEAFATPEEFAQAKELLRQYTLALVGVQNALPGQVEAAAGAGLASFAPNATNPSRRRSLARENFESLIPFARIVSVSAVAAMSPKPITASSVVSSYPPATTNSALPSRILSTPSSTETAVVAHAPTGWIIAP